MFYKPYFVLVMATRYVCVFNITPFFLPVIIQHNQCPRRFLNPREMQAL